MQSAAPCALSHTLWNHVHPMTYRPSTLAWTETSILYVSMNWYIYRSDHDALPNSPSLHYKASTDTVFFILRWHREPIFYPFSNNLSHRPNPITSHNSHFAAMSEFNILPNRPPDLMQSALRWLHGTYENAISMTITPPCKAYSWIANELMVIIGLPQLYMIIPHAIFIDPATSMHFSQLYY